jgi:F-type H+-transporting ATPase subunit beta
MRWQSYSPSPGEFVELADTIRSFKAICDGEGDALPEAAFYMVGTFEEAVAKAEQLAAQA